MLSVVALQKQDWRFARAFWCPVGSVVGIGGIPVIIFQTWTCALGGLASGVWTTKVLGAATLIVLVALWLNCVLVLASEAWDAPMLFRKRADALLGGASDTDCEDALAAALRAYGRDAAATAIVDARWKMVKAVVWAIERPLLVFYGLAICAAAFWLIPRCVGLCPDAEQLGFADWCFGTYLKVGPLGILCFATCGTIARTEYPRPFRRIYLDYNRLLKWLR